MEPPRNSPINWNFQRESQSVGHSLNQVPMNPVYRTPPVSTIVRTGTASQGTTGRPIGQVDIGESTSAYLFRVSLPGVDTASVDCAIETTGKVTVGGLTRTNNIVCRENHEFIMLSENMPPLGDFTVSFNLPGPVKHEACTCTIRFGLLECVVSKADS